MRMFCHISNPIPVIMKKTVFSFLLLLPVFSHAIDLLPVECSFDMGIKRRNWTHAKWKVFELPRPLKLDGAAGMVIQISTENLHPDVGVTVAIREGDGTWYSHPQAVDLVQKQNTGRVWFKDFSLPKYHQPPKGSFKDDNQMLDAEGATAIAVGIVNPLGVGKVSFTVEDILWVKENAPNLRPLQIQVTGELWEINGTQSIPVGVFGAYYLKNIRLPDGKNVPRTTRYRLGLDRQMDWNRSPGKPAVSRNPATPILVHTVGDRTQASMWLESGNWKSAYQKAGTSYGATAKRNGQQVYMEFWNEPYLNWANDNRINFNPRFFDVSKASEGGEVRLRHDGSVMPHLKWTKDFNAPTWNWTRAGQQEWRRGRDEKGRRSVGEHARPYKTAQHMWRHQVQEKNPPNSVKDGGTYTVKGKTYTAFTPWHIYDETQFTYWSGKGMLKPYLEPLKVYGSAIKAEAGDLVKIIAGWGNRPSEDHWAAWDMLYKPTIDDAIEVIDGYNDHDYGSDPRVMPANYEVVTGYGVATHGKWLYAYNTETASSADPQAVPGAPQIGSDAFKYIWVSTKLAAVLDFSIDKCRALMHFGLGGGFWSDKGEGVAMDLMRNLRGRLIYSVDSEDHIHVVTSVDGTDPLAPKPSDLPSALEQTTLLLNSGTQPREVVVQIVPAKGTQFASAELRTGVLKKATGTIELKKNPVSFRPEGFEWKGTLQPGFPILLTGQLKGSIAPDTAATVKTNQVFGKPVLETVRFDAPIQMTLNLGQTSNIRRARIRFVAERLREGEGYVEINGTRVALPPVINPENNPLAREFEIETSLLKANTTLTFGVTSDTEAGYRLGIASLLLDR